MGVALGVVCWGLVCMYFTATYCLSCMCQTINEYCIYRIGLVENNSKIECQNFRKLIFQKKLTLGKKNVEKYSKNKHLPNLIFPKEINYLANRCRPCPTGIVYSASYALFIVLCLYLYFFHNYSYKQSYYLLLF